MARNGARALALLAVVAATPAVASVPASAGTLGCDHAWSNKSAYSSHVTRTDVNYRKGPHTSCDSFGQWSRVKVYYHCWTYGDTVGGNRGWWHVRRAGTQQQGWVSETYLGITGNDPAERC
ncbi:hypothetical protein [Streptomyces benahoarensis]|uniref:SH3 domain-containing protein n=1 Tax=Streptomyces benahoarensis TaxID=2595054 RepID=A0A553ZDI8_9ACTN|nr:hypothetical protein [Streptomyces benahoarensis]TSB21372.1 hypothetical protein FNJ62_18900 [Streptomyces benahoarensis]TSB39516.1 hypothetical protein FNZ23_15510 [Streptomyces benahoarensis]